MAYQTGTVSDANSSLALYTVLADLLTAAGYTLVDTVVISTRTHKVWKSAAANNSMNLDWYLDAAYTTTGVGPLHLTPFEFFDPATDLGYRGPYNVADPIVDATYSSRYGNTGYALETNWFSSASGSYGTATTSTTFVYWISVTGDRVIALSSTQPDIVQYAGFYAPAPLYASAAGAKLFPLIRTHLAFQSASGSSGSFGLTRIAPLAVNMTTSSGYWSVMGYSRPEVGDALMATTPPIGTISPFGTPPTAVRLSVGNYHTGLSGYLATPVFGYLRGMFTVRPTPATVRGDTVTINGVTHVVTNGGTSNMCLAFEAV